MIEQEWMQFTSTGRIEDYLAYSRAQENGSLWKNNGGDAKEREQKDGADHCADRYGFGSDTHWGL